MTVFEGTKLANDAARMVVQASCVFSRIPSFKWLLMPMSAKQRLCNDYPFPWLSESHSAEAENDGVPFASL